MLNTTHLLILDFEVFVSGILVSVYLHVGYMTFLLGYPLVDFNESLQTNKKKKKTRRPVKINNKSHESNVNVTWFCGNLAFLLRITATPTQMAAIKDSPANANVRWTFLESRWKFLRVKNVYGGRRD